MESDNIELKLGGEYLVDELQIGVDGYYSYRLESITVVRETEKAFRIERECGKEFWFLKTWVIKILEEI